MMTKVSTSIFVSMITGPVTMGEVLTVLPFQNTLATFEASGQMIIDALENGVSQVEDGAGRFPQVAGLKYSWNQANEPGSRIVEQREGRLERRCLAARLEGLGSVDQQHVFLGQWRAASRGSGRCLRRRAGHAGRQGDRQKCFFYHLARLSVRFVPV